MHVRSFSLAALLAACHGQALTFEPSVTQVSRPAKTAAEEPIYFDADEPPCAYTVMGMFHAVYGGGTDSMQLMRLDAARRGFDGLSAMHCAEPGEVGADQGFCAAKGYICTR